MREETKKQLFNIPNTLSFIRLFLVPVYWAFFLLLPISYAFVVFLIASLTDVIDGRIARRFNMVTDFGKVLDPFADKFMQVSVLLSLAICSMFHWVFALIILCKELYMVISGIILYYRKVTVYSNFIGKASTIFINMSILMLFVAKLLIDAGNMTGDLLHTISKYVLIAGIVISIIAAIVYTTLTIRQLGTKLPDGNKKIDIKF